MWIELKMWRICMVFKMLILRCVYCKILSGNPRGGGGTQDCISIWINLTAHFKVKRDLFFPFYSLNVQQRCPSLKMQVLTGLFPLPCLMSTSLECEIVWNDLLLTLPTYPSTATSVAFSYIRRKVTARN